MSLYIEIFMRIVTLIIFLALLNFSASAQQIGIYDWASLQFYRSGTDVTETPNYIVYNAGSGLVFFNKNNLDDVRHVTTIDGLSGSDIVSIRYIAEAGKLWIYYNDGSFDLMDDAGQITNFQDIKNNNVLVPNKDLKAAVVDGRYIYLCFSFGMTEFDAIDQVFTNTLATEGGIDALTISGDRLYIVSNKKLYSIVVTGQTNIAYIGNWTEIKTPVPGTPGDQVFKGLATFDDKTYTTFSKKLYRINPDGTFDYIDTLKTINAVAYLNAGKDYLMVGGSCNPDGLINKNCIGEVALYNSDLQAVDYERTNNADLRYAIEADSKIWLADSYHGFRYINTPEMTAGLIDLNRLSPWSDDVDAILKTDDALYIAPGAHSPIYQGVGNKQGLFTYKDGFWTVQNLYNDPFFANPRPISDLSAFAYNANTGELAIASYTNGIISIKGDDRKIYDAENSALQTVPGDPNNTRVSDVAFDSRGNLWATNVLSPTSIYVRTESGADMGFANNYGVIRLTQMSIDPINEFIWCVEPSRGVIVYNPGENTLSSSDDQWALLPIYSSFENQNILPKSIYADKNGRIWVGTVSGIFVIDCGEDVFKSDITCDTRFPIIEDEGGLGPFLYGQQVNVITEDGAGRKWIGTNNGIYVTNSGMDKVVLHLTTENSPLADNNVTVLEIDQKPGIVYIGTKAGTQMYRTDASIGNPYHEPSLTIYPNPVRPGYEGPIVIQGLAHDSNVKISDINGRLLFETMSQGSQAIWYGKDFNGNRVASGVYYVLGTTTLNLENPSGIIGKIIFIK